MFKKILSTVLSAVTVAEMIPHIPAKAEENGTQAYPYTFFASSSEEGAITVNAGNFYINGNVATNGTIVSNGNININGAKTEQAEESMIYIFDKIDTRYFSGSNIDEHEDDYNLEELNININNPTEVYGEATLTGNININTALKTLEDVNLYGEIKNTNDSVIFSKYGDIVIDSQNVNLNGLVYAPFGNVTVNAQNLNLNNVVIIAQSIVLTCPNVNANTSSSMSSFVGGESEPLEIPYDEWEYMKDENDNGIPDFFEDINNWSQLKDSDGDKLPDCVEEFIGSESLNSDTDNDGIDDYYEVFVLFTDPTLVDSDENGTSDYDEDFDEDLLINGQEYLLETDPWNNDSDNDDISDGDEVNTYHTDPLKKDTDNDKLEDSDEFLFNTDPNNPDTNGNGILDGDEKFSQKFTYTVENEDCAVEEVIVSMNGTGNIQKNTSIESIMNKDMICSDVAGLVGEPFEIETESQFDNATISFKIDKEKLDETAFEDLMILWYDETNFEFIEMNSFYDEANSLVSTNTTHFSKYMIVDKNEWFEAWSIKFNYNPAQESYGAPTYTYNSVMTIDCSGSMKLCDPVISTNITSLYDSLYYSKTCQRIKAIQNFINNMNTPDKASIVLFSSDARLEASMTNNANVLKAALQKISDDGGTSFYNALTKSYKAFDESSFGKNNTFNRIILISDGEDGDYSSTRDLLDSIYYNGSTDKRKDIKIFTIGLGASYDSRLEEIASISGGEFYKAYTSEELIDILKKEGFNSAFDTTDADNDGLYDAVEVAGIRVQNGQIIHGCDPTKKDTDNDGLIDGQEIDPTIRIKNTFWCTPEIVETIGRSYYFVMKSEPVNDDDTDKDGYSDIEDPYPNNKPELIGDKYDFLDGEIYEIEATDTGKPKYFDVQKSSPAAGTSVIMYGRNENDNQKFKFEWCGTGYKIHSLINEDLVLTMSLNSSGEGDLYMDYDNDMPDQIWEVVPYFNKDMARDNITTTGLVIRSKVLYYEDEKSVGQPLYINYTDDETYVSTKRAYGARFVFNNITSWKRFGKMYMKHLGWLVDDNSKAVNRALKNYKKNIGNGISTENNVYTYNSIDLLLNQNHGEFPNLVYGENVKMSGVICEVIATYDALKLKGKIDDDSSYSKFFKLAVEFEVNIIKATPIPKASPIWGEYGPDGAWGSEPNKIYKCLNAYDVEYREYSLNDYMEYGASLLAAADMDNDLKKGDVFILSYNFDWEYAFLKVHTFSGVYVSKDTIYSTKILTQI